MAKEISWGDLVLAGAADWAQRGQPDGPAAVVSLVDPVFCGFYERGKRGSVRPLSWPL
jgi:hypothetical protein